MGNYTQEVGLSNGVSSSSMLALCVGKRMKVLLTYYSNVYLSAQVWKKLLVWQGITSDPMCWEEELNWTAQHARDKSTNLKCLECV